MIKMIKELDDLLSSYSRFFGVGKEHFVCPRFDLFLFGKNYSKRHGHQSGN